MDKRVINYLENKVRLTENNYLIISAQHERGVTKLVKSYLPGRVTYPFRRIIHYAA